MLLETGRRSEANEVVDAAVAMAAHHPVVVNPPLLDVLHRLGRVDEVAEAVGAMPDGPYARAARLWVSGDVRGAADVYASLELLPNAEAIARLAAGRGLAAGGRHVEADVELRRAIEFYAAVGARRYVGEAEALLSSAAEATAQRG